MTTKHYLVTGKDLSGKRFKKAAKSSMYILSHNIFNGTFWKVEDGKRKMIKQVKNGVCLYFNTGNI